jgi:hypothetical protein
MKNDIRTMMEFSKANVFKDIPGDYTISKDFLNGLTETEAKKGVTAFRDFLYAFFDYIAANESEFAPAENKTPAKYPVLRDLYQALLRIGMESSLDADSGIRLNIDCGKLSDSFKEARMRKIQESFVHV